MEGIFIFAVVVIACSSPVLIAIFLKQYFRYKSETSNKLALIELELAKGENTLLQKRVSNLQARVEVLERIATDDRFDLTQRISEL